MFRLHFVPLNMTVLKCLYRDKVSIRHPETRLLAQLTKDLAFRRAEHNHAISFPQFGESGFYEQRE